MRSTRGMIQIMWCHNLILDPFIVILETMLSIVTFKHKQIFYLKLIIFWPAYSQSILTLARSLFYFWCIQQIKHFFIIYLQKWTRNSNMFWLFSFFRLFKSIFYCSNRYSIIQIIRYWHFSSPLIRIIEFCCRLILIPLHCKSFTRTRLSICKNCGVETIDHFWNETRYLKLFKDFLLTILIVEDFVKTVRFLGVVILLKDRNFIFFGVDFHQVCFVIFVDFGADQRSNSYGNSDIWRHFEII